MTSNDDSPQPAPQKAPNRGWIFPVGGVLLGAYFLTNGALMLREKHGNGLFALLMAGIVVVVTTLAILLFKSYRPQRK